MDLREEINSAPRGTQAGLIEKTGLSKPTVIRALQGLRCSPGTARDIATAFGKPDRWFELVVITRPPRNGVHPLPPDPSLDPAA